MQRNLGPFRITLIYAAFGTAWILLSDRIATWLFPTLEGVQVAQTAKGLLYIALTAALVYGLVYRAERELRRSEQRYRELFEGSPDPQFVLDANGRILDANRAAEHRYGYSRDELLTMTARDLAVPALRDEAPDRFRLALETGALFAWRHLCKNGLAFPVEISARPIELNATRCVLSSVRDVSARHRAEEAARRSDERRRLAERIAGVGVWEWDVAGGAVHWSEEVLSIFGVRFGEFGGTYDEVAERVHPDDRAAWEASVRACVNDGLEHRTEFRVIHPDGSVRWVAVLGDAERDAGGQAVRMLGVVMDITERKTAEAERDRLEGQLRQAQKLEAIGQLAGGVAHDFNNLLTAIFGNVELAIGEIEGRLPSARDLLDYLQQIETGARRAAALTRQLLAFSRRQTIRPEVLNLNESLRELEKMLRRLIAENIELHFVLEPQLQSVKIDAGQLEQIVVNIAVNARDAMPNGGRLTLETRNVALDDAYVTQNPDACAGDHVLLAISDTGVGMDEATREHIFEPFFTTKPIGQGTGLGLATVYGIVMQTGGHISVYSEPGRGTCFRVYLPSMIEAATERQVVFPPSAPSGRETILLCEDDVAVRNLIARMLEGAGYTVIAATSPGQAMHLADGFANAIHLLLTDVIMPDLDGKRLSDALRARRPELKTLFVSGYTSSVIAHHGVLDDGVEFLEKPFTRQALLLQVRKVLDKPRDTANSE